MSYDNGFAKAQRSYDNQMPPEDETVDCPACEGTGKVSDSDGEGVECQECRGEGFINEKEVKEAAAEEYAEFLAEQRRERREEEGREE